MRDPNLRTRMLTTTTAIALALTTTATSVMAQDEAPAMSADVGPQTEMSTEASPTPSQDDMNSDMEAATEPGTVAPLPSLDEDSATSAPADPQDDVIQGVSEQPSMNESEPVFGADTGVTAPQSEMDLILEMEQMPIADEATPDASEQIPMTDVNAPQSPQNNLGTDPAQEADALFPETSQNTAPEPDMGEMPAQEEVAPLDLGTDTDPMPLEPDLGTGAGAGMDGYVQQNPALNADDPIQPEMHGEIDPAEPSADISGSLTTGEQGGTLITEENSRSSAEEFSTTATGERSSDRRSGLSNLESFGLGVVGGLAVGAILNNGDEVVANTGDRVIVERDDGTYAVYKDDDTLIRQPGSRVQVEDFDDGSTRTIVLNEDGTRIVTIRDATGHVLRRSRVSADSTEVVLIDDTVQVQPVDVSALPTYQEIRISPNEPDQLRAALTEIENRNDLQVYSLRQVRDTQQLRVLAPVIEVENINFRTGSAAIEASQAESLSDLGTLMRRMISQNPRELFLIEGHTDTVGSTVSNLALSDRRAESVALALTEYFRIPPENMVVQGYGESDLMVPVEGDEPRNRRVEVRVITPLITR